MSVIVIATICTYMVRKVQGLFVTLIKFINQSIYLLFLQNLDAQRHYKQPIVSLSHTLSSLTHLQYGLLFNTSIAARFASSNQQQSLFLHKAARFASSHQQQGLLLHNCSSKVWFFTPAARFASSCLQHGLN